MSTEKPKKVMFAPGVLEEMEQNFSPSDLQEIMNSIREAFENEDFIDESEIVDLDELQQTDPETYNIVKQRIEALDSTIDSTASTPKVTLH